MTLFICDFIYSLLGMPMLAFGMPLGLLGQWFEISEAWCDVITLCTYQILALMFASRLFDAQ